MDADTEEELQWAIDDEGPFWRATILKVISWLKANGFDIVYRPYGVK